MSQSHYEDPEVVRRYAQGPRAFVPGYEHMQRMAAQLVRERIGDSGEVLVLGAGGGLELETFATRSPHWNFLGVDPARGMLVAASDRIHAMGAGERMRWHNGYIF